MGKYRNYERIAYNLGRSYEYLDEDKSEDFKLGYKTAIEYVNNQVKKQNEYYSKLDKGEIKEC